MQVVKEQSTAFITVEFLNKNGTPEAPSAISYSVHDLATETILKPSTVLAPPASTVEVVLEPDVNVIVKAGKDKEAHRLTVIATYGASDQQTGEFVFYVKSLGGVT